MNWVVITAILIIVYHSFLHGDWDYIRSRFKG